MSEVESMILKIKNEIEKPFVPNGYWLTNTHIELGNSLHTEDFYFAKKFFQNKENCNIIAEMLAERLSSPQINIPNNTTLVGHGNYTGLFLRQTVEKIGKFNYAVVQNEPDSNFSWQYMPELKENILFVLPITVTSNIYFRLRRFIYNYAKHKMNNTEFNILEDFVNVFLILDETLREGAETTFLIEKLKESNPHAYNIYKPFNWVKIEPDKVSINTNPTYRANSLIRLYSPLHLSEKCEACFPTKQPITAEKLLFPTQDNYQTPNLIFGFPNFSVSSPSSKTFVELFNPFQGGNAHLHGHIQVNNKSYDNFIRGNVFYENNKEDILHFFNIKIGAFLSAEDNNIIFITSDSKYKSNFIEDISSQPCLRNRAITIFRFQPYQEFVDNFISLYGNPIKSGKTKVIYFQEVLSGGREFKLISDYIKHIHDQGYQIGLPGFHMLITLVNRLSEYTKNELIRKLYYQGGWRPEERLLYYFHLNAPLLSSSSHIGDPLQNHRRILQEIKKSAQLDTLKLRIEHILQKNRPQDIYDFQSGEGSSNELFPLLTGQLNKDQKIINAYFLQSSQYKLDLLHLYLTHLINNELAQSRYKDEDLLKRYEQKPESFFYELLTNIMVLFEPNAHNFFTTTDNYNTYLLNRIPGEERELIKTMLLKILCKPPFIFYKTIYESIFKYTLITLNSLNERMDTGNKITFKHFKKFKFYIRRSLELNSNFIISKNFLSKIKIQLTAEFLDRILTSYREKINLLEKKWTQGEIERSFFDLEVHNFENQEKDVLNYPFFVLLCFKEFIYSNPSRSVHIESLVNSPELQPRLTNGSVKELVADYYYHFITMLKVENVALLKKLCEFHKKNWNGRQFGSYNDFIRYYITNTKNDPIILNARKFLAESLYSKDTKELVYIRQSLYHTLNVISKLEDKRNQTLHISDRNEDSGFNIEIKEILDMITEILQPGIQSKLDYIFCVEYRRRLSTDDAKNIYTLVSDNISFKPVDININTKGLVYNLLYGLHASSDMFGEQTFLTTAVCEDEIASFQPVFHYFDPYLSSSNFTSTAPNTTVSISELYRNDVLDTQTGIGFPGLSESKMTLAFRFSWLAKPSDNNGRELAGQAVLLIMNKEEPTPRNFERFMNAEKIRMLMLLKDDLLEYLHKQFKNDAFIQLLENRKREIYQRKLEHGLGGYRIIQNNLFKDSLPIWKLQQRLKNKELYDLIDKATIAQLDFQKQNYKDETLERYSTKAVIRRMQRIFASPCFNGHSIKREQVNYQGFDTKYLWMKKSFFDVIITELIINMKKYSSRLVKNGLSITYQAEKNMITFENDIADGYIRQRVEKEYGGIHMCREIIRILKIQEMPKPVREGQTFTVTVYLTPIN